LAFVSKLSTAARRLPIGQPFRSDRLSHTPLPKRIALPVFASDALSSVAYAPEEVFLMLSVAGVSAYAPMPEALTVSVDDAETRDLVHRWEDSDITCPVLDYVKPVSKASPRTVVTVSIPEYVVGHCWQVLHNQRAPRLKGRLLFMPNAMVTSVPWQLNSSERLKTFQPHAAPGDARRGIFD
jgi:hypothetical protein